MDQAYWNQLGMYDHSMVILVTLFLALVAPSTRPVDSPTLEAALRSAIAGTGAEVAVALQTLDGRDQVLIDADTSFHAASTMKIPVMIELFRQANTGQLSLDEPLTIRNEFKSIVDGSPYKLSEGDDSDKEIYAAIGTSLTLRQLCEAMITGSSNFAANLLIERLGVENIRRTVRRLGADGMDVLRGVEDQKAFDRGLNNSTTARALMVLLERLATGRAVNATVDAEMIGMLKRQKFNDAIPAGLVGGITVAHKTGNIRRIHHDAAIVYAERPYVLVVLVRGIEDQKASASVIAQLSRIVYGHLQAASSFRLPASVFQLRRPASFRPIREPYGERLVIIALAERLEERLDGNGPPRKRELGAIEQHVQTVHGILELVANDVLQRFGERRFAAPASAA